MWICISALHDEVKRGSKDNPTLDIVLCAETDEYFEDDIVSRFVDFGRIVYGEASCNAKMKGGTS